MKLKNRTVSDSGGIRFFVITSAVCFLLSSSVIPFLGAKGRGISPDLLLCLCCLLPKFLPVKSSCIFAVVLGFLSDLFINLPFSFSPVIYLAAAVLTPLFYSGFKRVGTVTASVCALCVLFIKSLAGAVTAYALDRSVGFGELLIRTALPELMVNFAFTLLIGFVLKVLCTRFGIANSDY